MVRLDPAFEGELLGAPVVLRSAPGFTPLPLAGTLLDESLGTFLVREDSTGRVRRVSKTGLAGTIWLAGRELPLSGDALRFRPEDRTKRLAWRGHRKDP